VFFPPDIDSDGAFDPEEDAGVGISVDPETDLPEDTPIDPRIPFEAPAVDDEGEPVPFQIFRYLRVTNETDDTITVFLRYRTQDEDGTWIWAPSPPGEEDVLSYDIEPGETLDLTDPDLDDARIATSGIRFWAESEDTEYTMWKDQTLWVVPLDRDGKRRYRSPVIQTFHFTIR
jgi:hypothetical protein